MKILIIIFSIIILLIISLYLFWRKLVKGKPGRISGEDLEKKTYDEALVVDVRWRKEYARTHAKNAINVPIKLLKNKSKILKKYKDKDIILYCTVDVTSRNAEKLLREQGFTKLHIGDGVKQYKYMEVTHKNVLLGEMKYIINNKDHLLVNVGDVELSPEEIKLNDLENIDEKVDKNKLLIIYSDDAKRSLEVSSELGKKGYNVINLIEPFDFSAYVMTTYDKKDYMEDKAEEAQTDCG